MMDYNSIKDVKRLIRQKKDEIRRIDQLATKYVLAGETDHFSECIERIWRREGDIDHLTSILESLELKEL